MGNCLGRIRFHRPELPTQEPNLVPLTAPQTKKTFLLVGPSGSGKSNFAEMVTGRTGLTSHYLEPFTKEIAELQVASPEFESSEIWLVDTPGLNSSTNEIEVFRMLSEWLIQQSMGDRNLAGLLYFHSISEPRWTGMHSRMLRGFMQIFERDLGKLIFVTTMWDDVSVNEEMGTKREGELRKHLLSTFQRDMSIQRFVNNRRSAIEILKSMNEDSGT